eukprot:2818210-Heterocapsa_arctica.AAC.1
MMSLPVHLGFMIPTNIAAYRAPSRGSYSSRTRRYPSKPFALPTSLNTLRTWPVVKQVLKMV